ncbi:MAG TPA: rhodanese-like domain-containing protein [Saprospiraceae bacterium]|nr:rhodanese-like domain-containing protein [Saprospiraceae bacterium]
MEPKDNTCNIRRWDILKRELTHLEPDAFLRKLTSLSDYTLLDVRTPKEFAAGSLPQAVNMDFLGDDFWDIFERIDKERPVLVFCRSSRRSIRTAMFMKNGGFREVYNLEGGLNKLLAQFPEAIFPPA